MGSRGHLGHSLLRPTKRQFFKNLIKTVRQDFIKKRGFNFYFKKDEKEKKKLKGRNKLIKKSSAARFRSRVKVKKIKMGEKGGKDGMETDVRVDSKRHSSIKVMHHGFPTLRRV